MPELTDIWSLTRENERKIAVLESAMASLPNTLGRLEDKLDENVKETRKIQLTLAASDKQVAGDTGRVGVSAQLIKLLIAVIVALSGAIGVLSAID